MFVDQNVNSLDFHLQSVSLAIDAGDPLNCADYDFDDSKRNYGQGVDCGAYEFGTGSPNSKTFSLSGYISCNIKTHNTEINKGIKVEIIETGAYIYTDSDGYFQLENVPYNDKGYLLRISKSKFLTREISDIRVVENMVIGSKSTPVTIWSGDINLDGALTIEDILLISKVLNSVIKDSSYDSLMDLNSDTAINLEDVMIIAKNFGKKATDYPLLK